MSFLSDVGNKLGRFSSYPANMIDRAFLEEPRSGFGKLWKGLKVRLMYTLLFMPMLVVDMAVSALVFFRYMVGALFRSDTVQEEYLAYAKKYGNYFSKSLFALLATPIALFEPEAALFFVEDDEQELAAGKYYRAKGVEVKHPANQDELCTLIAEANENGKKVSIMGAGRSQGMQFLPSDTKNAIVIDMSGLNKIEPIDLSNNTVRVGAGVIWKDLQREANKQSLALKVMQASNIFSVGGSIGTNIHGWDYHTGTISNAIKSIDVLLGDGTIAPDIKPRSILFKQVVGGFGMHGIVIAATLELTPNELLKRTSVLKKPDEYVEYFNGELKDKKENRLHLYRLSLEKGKLLKTGFTETYVVDEAHPDPVQTQNFNVERARGRRYERFFVRLAKRFKNFMSLIWQRERDAFQKEEPVLTTNEIMQAPINALFTTSVSETEWLQEYFIPGDDLAAFTDELGDLLMKNNVALLNATVRFVKRHDGNPLSPSYGSDRFAVVLCFNQSLQPDKMVQAQKWLRESQALTVKHHGSVYLPYQHMLSPEVFNASYPHARMAADFKENTSDVGGRFSSGFYEKYFVTPDAATNGAAHVRHVMGTGANREKFKGFLSNILKRVDADKLYVLLDDILLYKDTHAELYAELCRRLPEIMPMALTDVSNQLSSLYAIKGDLTKQAHLLLPDDLREIKGLVEVGSPGRFVNGFRDKYKVTGDVVAVHEKESMMDCVDAGAWKPYKTFIPLDYQNLDLSSLEDESVDIVTCYVGLHHFTPEKLTLFLNDVQRILRANGRFMLVDHDAYNPEVKNMAHMAHFVFNAVNGVSLEDELTEVRDFKSMQAWLEILDAHGLYNATDAVAVPMVRVGDPTENRMIAFTTLPRLELVESPTPSPTSSRRVSPISMFPKGLVEEGDAPYFGYDSDEEPTVWNTLKQLF
jgi:UDP-N-acetylenolpyruvoylglucosamine reductase